MVRRLTVLREVFWWFFTAAAVAVCGASICGFLKAPVWPLSLACHFPVPYFILLTMSGLIFLAGRRIRPAVVFLVIGCTNLILVAPLYFGPAAEHGRPTIRLISVNVHARNRQHEKFIDFIRRAAPDLLLLIEVSDQLNDRFADLRSEFPFVKKTTGHRDFDLALYSRLPFEDAKLVSIGGDPRAPCLRVEIQVQGKSVVVLGAHVFPARSPRAYQQHKQQLSDLAHLARVARSAKKEVLLVGDLNTTSWSREFEQLEQSSGLRDSRRGFGVQPTWPTSLPCALIPIDHCLVSPGIEVQRRRVSEHIGSDHYPITIDWTVQVDPVSGKRTY